MRKRLLSLLLALLFCLPVGGMAIGEGTQMDQLALWTELGQWVLDNPDATRTMLALDITATEEDRTTTLNFMGSIEKNTDGGLQLRMDVLEDGYVGDMTGYIQTTPTGIVYRFQYDNEPVFIELPDSSFTEWYGDESGAALFSYLNGPLREDLPIWGETIGAVWATLTDHDAAKDLAGVFTGVESEAMAETASLSKAVEGAIGSLSSNLKLMMRLEELKLFDALGVPKNERRLMLMQAAQALQQMIRESDLTENVTQLSAALDDEKLMIEISDGGENSIALDWATTGMQNGGEGEEHRAVDELRLVLVSPYEHITVDGELTSVLTMGDELSLTQQLTLSSDVEGDEPISYAITLSLMMLNDEPVEPIVAVQEKGSDAMRQAIGNQEIPDAPVDADGPYTFADASVEMAVREILQRYGDEPITRADLQTVTMLNLYEANVQSLSDIALMNNLMFLYLDKNNLDDISALAGLTNLMSLSLSDNQLQNVDALAGLINLSDLYLDDNPLTNIDGLAGLTNLYSLSISGLIDGEGLTSCEAVRNLTNLYSLSLSFNEIEDISPLARLTNLTSLYLTSNRIIDVEPLAGMTQLTTLYLANNRIEDISPIQALLDGECDVDLEDNPVYDTVG